MHVLLKITRLKLSFAGAMCAVALVGSNVSAQTAEIEGNDSVATAQVLPSGVLVATGFLGSVTGSGATLVNLNPIDIDGSAGPDLSAFSFGTVDGLAGNTNYIVETTAPIGGTFGPLGDTILGQFDSPGTGGNVIAFDDDGGNGALSKFTVPADAAGDLHVAVSVFGDGGFAGSGVQGSFGLTVSEVGSVLSNDQTADYFEFTGLTPGVTYTATTAPDVIGGLDPVLGLFDAAGNLLQDNDDGPFGDFYSQLMFTATSSSAFLAVTDVDDRTTPVSGPQYNGGYSGSGDYRLTLVAAVPEPTSGVVLGLFGLCGLARRRRN